MSDKSDTEKLCAMLDERGIEYCADENGVGWHSAYHPNDFAYDAAWYLDTTAKPHTIGALSETTIYGLTPEQTIEATLGAHSTTSLKENDVVHCKDCKYAHINVYGMCKYCDVFVLNNDGEYEPQVCLDGNFFCGFGEVRES